MRLLLRASLPYVEEKRKRKARLYRLAVSFWQEDIFANPSELVGSGRGYRMSCYPADGTGNESISFQPLVEFHLPCDDYKVYRR